MNSVTATASSPFTEKLPFFVLTLNTDPMAGIKVFNAILASARDKLIR